MTYDLRKDKMGRIKMTKIEVTDKIHIDDLRSLNMVNIDRLVNTRIWSI